MLDAQGKAFVDGKLVASDLFADFNARVKGMRGGRPLTTSMIVYEIGLWVLLVLPCVLAISYWR